MASFTTVGDSVEIQVRAVGEVCDVDISGTYDMTIALQRENGSPHSGAWQTMTSWDTANATVAYSFINDKPMQRYRLVVLVDTSGTATATLAEAGTDVAYNERAYTGSNREPGQGDKLIEFTQAGAVFPGNVTVTGNVSVTGEITNGGVVDITAAAVTLDPATHGNGKVVTLNRAGGIAVTLPDATGSGDKYFLVVGTTFTGAASIAVPDAANIMVGTATLFADGGDTVLGFATAADSDTVDLLGTSNSTGGIAGAQYEFVDIAADTWFVRIVSDAGGTEATPFSANVS